MKHLFLIITIASACCGCRTFMDYESSGLAQKDVVIEKNILTENPCYASGRKIAVKGLMLHSVGCPAPSGRAWVKAWNKPDYNRACVHAFIDAHTGIVFQTLPWNHRGWHAGGRANDTHIGVEMCESEFLKYVGGATFECSDIEKSQEMAWRTYHAAVNLFAYLCYKYRLDPLEKGVVISHKEGHALGIASGHVDPEHLWRQLNMPLSMDIFRKDVNKKLAEYQYISNEQ